jgi:hypothetical protein
MRARARRAWNASLTAALAAGWVVRGTLDAPMASRSRSAAFPTAPASPRSRSSRTGWVASRGVDREHVGAGVVEEGHGRVRRGDGEGDVLAGGRASHAVVLVPALVDGDLRLVAGPLRQVANQLRDALPPGWPSVLIPSGEYAKLQRLVAGGVTASSIERFADRLGVAPGIVVGRLQHDGLLAFNQLNHLKTRLELPGRDPDSPHGLLQLRAFLGVRISQPPVVDPVCRCRIRPRFAAVAVGEPRTRRLHVHPLPVYSGRVDRAR